MGYRNSGGFFWTASIGGRSSGWRVRYDTSALEYKYDSNTYAFSIRCVAQGE